jgi:hypothetical protein
VTDVATKADTAIEATLRLIAGAFRRDGEELSSERRPRFSIPARLDNDDIFVIDTIKEFRSLLEAAERDKAQARNAALEEAAAACDARADRHAKGWAIELEQPLRSAAADIRALIQEP